MCGIGECKIGGLKATLILGHFGETRYVTHDCGDPFDEVHDDELSPAKIIKVLNGFKKTKIVQLFIDFANNTKEY